VQVVRAITLDHLRRATLDGPRRHRYHDSMEVEMAQLIVRNLDEGLVEALKARAATHGRSAEAEHRAILYAALHGPAAGKSLWEWLAAMPDMGDDQDFARQKDLPRDVEL
jgi:plasmid stability protein